MAHFRFWRNLCEGLQIIIPDICNWHETRINIAALRLAFSVGKSTLSGKSTSIYWWHWWKILGMQIIPEQMFWNLFGIAGSLLFDMWPWLLGRPMCICKLKYTFSCWFVGSVVVWPWLLGWPAAKLLPLTPPAPSLFSLIPPTPLYNPHQDQCQYLKYK